MPESKSTTRRRWLALPALGANACVTKPAMPPNLFPESVDGVWTRTQLRDLPVDEAPDPVPRTAVDHLQTASYKGPGDLEARVYLLDSEDTGRVLGTRWRPSADTVFFNYKRFFVVLKWQSPDRKAVQSFVAQLQKRLGAVQSK